MDRGLVQPPPPAHLDRLSQSRGLRTAVHSRRGCGMIVQEANCPENRGRVTLTVPSWSEIATLPSKIGSDPRLLMFCQDVQPGFHRRTKISPPVRLTSQMKSGRASSYAIAIGDPSA